MVSWDAGRDGFGPTVTSEDVEETREMALAMRQGWHEREIGVYRKYRVERIWDSHGKHRDCRYFVLDPAHDPHARTALLAYADACEGEMPALAADLRVMAATPAPVAGEEG